MASGISAFRIADQVRSLQGTVRSIVGGSRVKPLRIEDAWPEVGRVAGIQKASGIETLRPENVHALMERLSERWEDD